MNHVFVKNDAIDFLFKTGPKNYKVSGITTKPATFRNWKEEPISNSASRKEIAGKVEQQVARKIAQCKCPFPVLILCFPCIILLMFSVQHDSVASIILYGCSVSSWVFNSYKVPSKIFTHQTFVNCWTCVLQRHFCLL